MGERRCTYRVSDRKPDKRDHLEDPGLYGIVILKRILKKWDGVWIGLFWLRIRTANCCERGNKPSIRSGNFLTV
jgi:hypothetical protein